MSEAVLHGKSDGCGLVRIWLACILMFQCNGLAIMAGQRGNKNMMELLSQS